MVLSLLRLRLVDFSTYFDTYVIYILLFALQPGRGEEERWQRPVQDQTVRCSTTAIHGGDQPLPGNSGLLREPGRYLHDARRLQGRPQGCQAVGPDRWLLREGLHAHRQMLPANG